MAPDLAPGCYWRTPVCHKHKELSSISWKCDFWGEDNAGGAQSRDVCEVARRISLNSWCGTDDVETHYVPQSKVDKFGCVLGKELLITSHRGQQLEDMFGTVGLRGDTGEWQKWTVSDAENGKVFLKS